MPFPVLCKPPRMYIFFKEVLANTPVVKKLSIFPLGSPTSMTKLFHGKRLVFIVLVFDWWSPFLFLEFTWPQNLKGVTRTPKTDYYEVRGWPLELMTHLYTFLAN